MPSSRLVVRILWSLPSQIAHRQQVNARLLLIPVTGTQLAPTASSSSRVALPPLAFLRFWLNDADQREENRDVIADCHGYAL